LHNVRTFGEWSKPVWGRRMAEEITALWQEAEQQLQHGAWLPARKERGIAYTTANRFIRLRRQ